MKLSTLKDVTNNNGIDDMYKLYDDNKPHRNSNDNNDFTVDNFYDFSTSENDGKFKCSYSKAIAIGLGVDTFKKTLLKGDSL